MLGTIPPKAVDIINKPNPKAPHSNSSALTLVEVAKNLADLFIQAARAQTRGIQQRDGDGGLSRTLQIPMFTLQSPNPIVTQLNNKRLLEEEQPGGCCSGRSQGTIDKDKDKVNDALERYKNLQPNDILYWYNRSTNNTQALRDLLAIVCYQLNPQANFPFHENWQAMGTAILGNMDIATWVAETRSEQLSKHETQQHIFTFLLGLTLRASTPEDKEYIQTVLTTMFDNIQKNQGITNLNWEGQNGVKYQLLRIRRISNQPVTN